MPDLVLTSRDAAVTTITLNRPEQRNALSPGLIGALERTIADLHEDDETRVVILTGAGRCFCAGMDLKGVIDDPEAMAGMLHGLGRVMLGIRRLPVPTIARVQGAAIGGGCGLMVVTDFAVTHPEAKVGYPEVSLGVCPAVVAPWLMRRVGAGRARAMLLGGGTMTGQAGYEAGLATHLAGREELDTATTDLARGLARGGRRALAVTKQWLNELDGPLDEQVAERGATLSAEVIAGEEARERLQRFLQR
jgi:methylglutaconyl-CoA hydratase